MDTHKRQLGQVGTTPETHRYLTAAEYFLRDRNFDECRNYALRARDSDLTHPGPTRILAIATALSAPTISSARHDYYAVFSLPHFEPDAARIRYSFRTLTSNLNPNVNPYPLAAEAFDLVLRAWSVLSNPSEKARFDDELRRSLSAGGGGTSGIDGGTFWTMCPYCYYVYEYDRVYEDCCLRCSNEKCRRVLHALAIRAPPPPPDVVEKGQYWCAGFIPFGISGINGEEIGEKLWDPFESPPAGSASKGCDQNVACNGEEGVVVDISDDDDDDDDDDDEIAATGFQDHGIGNSGEMKDSVGGVINRNGIENGFLENGAKQARMRRKKSVPWNSKKLMGGGIKVDEDQANSICGLGEDGDSDANQDTGDDLERGFGCETSNGVESGMEFFEGEDDVLIGLRCGFDLEDGDMSFLNA